MLPITLSLLNTSPELIVISVYSLNHIPQLEILVSSMPYSNPQQQTIYQATLILFYMSEDVSQCICCFTQIYSTQCHPQQYLIHTCSGLCCPRPEFWIYCFQLEVA